jgi:hypothetical protein
VRDLDDHTLHAAELRCAYALLEPCRLGHSPSPTLPRKRGREDVERQLRNQQLGVGRELLVPVGLHREHGARTHVEHVGGEGDRPLVGALAPEGAVRRLASSEDIVPGDPLVVGDRRVGRKAGLHEQGARTIVVELVGRLRSALGRRHGEERKHGRAKAVIADRVGPRLDHVGEAHLGDARGVIRRIRRVDVSEVGGARSILLR